MSELDASKNQTTSPNGLAVFNIPPSKRTRNSLKPILLHLLQKHFMMFRQTFVISPDLPNETVLPHATRALGIVFSQTPG